MDTIEKEQPEKKKTGLSKTKKLIIIIAAAYLLATVVLAFLYDARHVRIYLENSDALTVEYGEHFNDPGLRAYTVGKLFGKSKKELETKTVGQVDTNTLGTYELKYKAHWLFRDYITVRTVTVVDTVAPVIELKHLDGGGGNWLTGYEEEGYTATDNHDGDITDKVQRRVTNDLIYYTVKDSSGNETQVERESHYNETAPVIELLGDEKININARFSYDVPGCTAHDAQGNDYTQYIQTEGNFMPYRAGSYEIKYFITNDVGDTVSAVRTITVEANPAPEIYEPSGKTIYLTFDDGPGPYTGQLLDLLARYGAKATFFVTGENSTYRNMIGRASREGHSIGVHTYSHNYQKIYSSEDAFFTDFNAVEDMIYNQTGHYTQICRFPGGSSNTVSSFNPGIMSRLAASLSDLGYRYFDWNVSSGDAGQTKDTDEVAENVITGCSNMRLPVVLQHDIKDYSVAAVEQILIWGENNGYTFRALTENSPENHHGIAN